MKAVVVALIGLAFFVALNALLYGFVLMLTVGALHAELGWPSQTIGYLPAVLISAALTFLAAMFRSKA